VPADHQIVAAGAALGREADADKLPPVLGREEGRESVVGEGVWVGEQECGWGRVGMR
jgi:hypothetical protein